ncbi:DUF2271 domain-containing protein [Saccharicrinis sp. FJH2]|uniref:DUF2271 domain-containing protein n=1 Tax=Saccharicrinis sp. FJH65 TaxID=3344659 RepID=UPI0035F3C57F
MKKIFGALVFLMILPDVVNAQNTARVDFTVDVSNIQGPYTPKHVMAIWIVDATGNYVNSLAVYGNERLGNLWAWWAASKGLKADAITGATQLQFQTYSVTWNLKDYNENTVPDGTYVMWVEATSDDWEGPNYSFEFTVGGSAYTLKPEGNTHFTNLELGYVTNDNTPVSKVFSQAEIEVYPNPVQSEIVLKSHLSMPALAHIDLVDLSGKTVDGLFSGMIFAGDQTLTFSRDPMIKTGNYFITLKTDRFIWTKKIVLE